MAVDICISCTPAFITKEIRFENENDAIKRRREERKKIHVPQSSQKKWVSFGLAHELQVNLDKMCACSKHEREVSESEAVGSHFPLPFQAPNPKRYDAFQKKNLSPDDGEN